MCIQVSMLLSVSFFSQCIFTHRSTTSAPKAQRENRREPTFPVEIFSVGNQYCARNRLLSFERHRLVILDSIIFTFAFPITLAFFIILEEHLLSSYVTLFLFRYLILRKEIEKNERRTLVHKISVYFPTSHHKPICKKENKL